MVEAASNSGMTTSIVKYKPYPTHRPSGVEWLGDIPSHWEVSRLKFVGELQGGAGFPHEEQWNTTQKYPFFKVGDMGVNANQRDMAEYQHTVSADTATRLGAYLFPTSTIVFAKVGAALMLNRRRMIVRPSCIDNNMMGFIPRGPDPGWMMYWLTGLDLGKLANPGAVPSVNEGQLKEQEVIIPPLPEQRAIAAFLDRETARIDELVAKKERLIELLQEKRTALITRAVTRGLDPNAPMKDSGVEWLGEIPAHWEVKRLKYLVGKMGSGKTPRGGAERYVDDGVMLLRSQNVHFGKLNLGDVAYIDADTDNEMAGSRVGEGDVLLNITGASLGRSCVARLEGIDANVNQHVCVLRPDQQQDESAFLAYSIESRSLQDQIFNNENGVSRDALNFEQIGDLVFARPAISEQQAIAECLDRETAKLDSLIVKILEAIERLKELRTALTSAAVTGRIDVQEGSG